MLFVPQIVLLVGSYASSFHSLKDTNENVQSFATIVIGLTEHLLSRALYDRSILGLVSSPLPITCHRSISSYSRLRII